MIPQLFGFVALVGFVGLLFGKDNSELELLVDASKGKPVGYDRLSDTYWKLFAATEKKPSEWMALNRFEKSEVLKVREELRELFDKFPAAHQKYIMKQRPENRKY